MAPRTKLAALSSVGHGAPSVGNDGRTELGMQGATVSPKIGRCYRAVALIHMKRVGGSWVHGSLTSGTTPDMFATFTLVVPEGRAEVRFAGSIVIVRLVVSRDVSIR